MAFVKAQLSSLNGSLSTSPFSDEPIRRTYLTTALPLEFNADNYIPFSTGLSPGDPVDIVQVDTLDRARRTTAAVHKRIISGLGTTGFKTIPAYAMPITYPIGAVGDGVTNDLVPLKAALDSGLVVDGLNRTYGISGTLQPSTFAGLINCKLKQLSPTASATTKTLHINTKNDWFIQNVEIDCGSVQNYPAVGDISGTYCGFRATSCSGFNINGLRVKNGGPFNGVMFSSCDNWTYVNSEVRDFIYNLAVDPIDEVIQGVYIQLCTNFLVSGCRVRNMTGFLSGSPSQARSRGMAFSGNVGGRILGNFITNVDEAFDFTGTAGSSYMLVEGNDVLDVASYAYKFTGSSVDNICANNIARKAGLVSFICIGGSGSGGPASHGMIFRNCHSYDVGGNTIPFYGTGQRYGFRVSQGSVALTEQYSVMLDSCSAVDDQLTPTMDGGAFTDVQPTGGVNRNVLRNFVSRGHISFAASGFSLPSPRTISSGMQVPDSGTVGNDTIPSATEVYRVEIYIPESMNITGFAWLHGSAHVAGNVKLGLSDANGFVVASTASTAVNTNDNGYQRVAASATYFAVQGTYFLLLALDQAGNKFRTHTFGNFGADKQTSQVYGTFVDAAGPTTFAINVGPIMSLY